MGRIESQCKLYVILPISIDFGTITEKKKKKKMADERCLDVR